MHRAAHLLVFFMLLGTLNGQDLAEIVERDRVDIGFRVLSYNVENLFDTIADGSHQDEEFLPQSEKQYNTGKYRHKIGNLAKVIRSVGGWKAPELVGLIEVENRGVLIDLARHESLKKGQYRIAHFDSPDPRGIDVGLLYDSTMFELIQLSRIPITEKGMRTRDILFVSLKTNSSDTIHVFVNHWSSRRGGKEKSSYKREIAAKVLKSYTDSLYEHSPDVNMIIMGDLNDSPQDKSAMILSQAEHMPLVNLCDDLDPNTGTYKYRGVWDVIDQVMVSQAMVSGASGLQVKDAAVIYNDRELLIEDDKYGDYYPKRCWKGNFYNGGYSDHLPLFIDVYFTK